MTYLRALVALGLTVACRSEEAAGPGRLDVAWTGADTGELQLPASARWCANDSLVEITGASGDSGVALAVLPVDTAIAPGTFPVGLPLRVRSRPGARVAIRWPAEPLTEGFYGLSGTVTIDAGTDLSGRLEATLKSVNDGREISMNGTFRELRVLPGSPESCGVHPPDSLEVRQP